VKKVIEIILFSISTAALVWLIYWANISYSGFMVKHHTEQDINDLKAQVTALEQNRR
jgi:cell division protein FtsB